MKNGTLMGSGTPGRRLWVQEPCADFRGFAFAVSAECNSLSGD